MSRPAQHKPLSDRTLHGYARAIRAFWAWLVDEGYLTDNPMARLKLPKLEKRHKTVLTVGEVDSLGHHALKDTRTTEAVPLPK